MTCQPEQLQKARTRAKGDAELTEDVRALENDKDTAAVRYAEALLQAQRDANTELLQAIYTTVCVS